MYENSSSLNKKLIESAFPNSRSAAKPKVTRKPLDEFAENMTKFPDKLVAASIVGNKAEHTWTSDNGERLGKLEAEVNNLEHEKVEYQKMVDQLDDCRNKTAYKIKNPAAISPEPLNWADVGKAVATFIALALLLACGWGGAYGNLVGSGNPIFIDKPWVAFLISSMFPVFSIGLKWIGDILMPHDKARKLYACTVATTFATSTLVWLYCYARQFTGIATDIGMADLLNPAVSGWLFVFVTTTTELTGGAWLWMVFDKQLDTFFPPREIVNPAWTCLNERYQFNWSVLQKTRLRIGEIKNALIPPMISKREEFVAEKTAEFIAHVLRNGKDD